MALFLSRRIVVIQSAPFVRHASSALPRIAQPELWRSILPKFLRRSNTERSEQTISGFRLFLRNPATHVAGLAVLCGSQAIQVIYLKNEASDKNRTSEAKIRLLGNVIERIKAGEPVDIKQELGTGDPEREKEWQDLIDEIGDDSTWLRNRKGSQTNSDVPKPAKRDSLSLLRQAASGSFFKNSNSAPKSKQDMENSTPKEESKKPSFY